MQNRSHHKGTKGTKGNPIRVKGKDLSHRNAKDAKEKRLLSNTKPIVPLEEVCLLSLVFLRKKILVFLQRTVFLCELCAW